MQDRDKMLTFTEVGRRLGVSNHMVIKLVRHGAIQAFAPVPGNPRRIWESGLIRFREQSRNYRENREESEISKPR